MPLGWLKLACAYLSSATDRRFAQYSYVIRVIPLYLFFLFSIRVAVLEFASLDEGVCSIALRFLLI
jgi:hypothetical protein